jgi:hypothetical protein
VWKGVLQWDTYIFQTCFFTILHTSIILDVYLLYMQMCCYKGNHTADMTRHKTKNYFLCSLLNVDQEII